MVALSHGTGPIGALGWSIGRVKAHFGSVATGTIRHGTVFVCARREHSCYLATAGHVLFKHGTGTYPHRLEIDLGLSGAVSAWARVYDDARSRCFVHPEFEAGSELDADVDIGLIRVESLPQRIARIPVSSSLPAGDRATIVGYPQGASSPVNVRVTVAPSGTENFDYDEIVNVRGLSGAPLLSLAAGTAPQVVGVHTRGEPNSPAIRLSESVRATLRQWIDG